MTSSLKIHILDLISKIKTISQSYWSNKERSVAKIFFQRIEVAFAVGPIFETKLVKKFIWLNYIGISLENALVHQPGEFKIDREKYICLASFNQVSVEIFLSMAFVPLEWDNWSIDSWNVTYQTVKITHNHMGVGDVFLQVLEKLQQMSGQKYLWL